MIVTDNRIQDTTTISTLSQVKFIKVEISNFLIFYVKYKDWNGFRESFEDIFAASDIDDLLKKDQYGI